MIRSGKIRNCTVDAVRKGLLGLGLVFVSSNFLVAQDWPQWRGPDRDAKATEFQSPHHWPSELIRAWSVPVGYGAATPALVDGKLYVFSQQDHSEVLRCLDAATGFEHWRMRYQVEPVAGWDRGPGSSPAVANG